MEPRRTTLLTTTLVLAAAVTHAQAPPTPAPASPVRVDGIQAGLGTAVVAGPGSRLALVPGTPADAPRLLDEQLVAVETWTSGWPPGRHQASVHLPGPTGAPEPAPPLAFIFDPAPPVVQHEVGSADLLEGYGLDQDVERERPPRHTDPERHKRVPVLWSPDGRRWLPILPRDARPDEDGVLADWLIAADRPQVFLWALRDGAFSSGAPIAPRKLEVVRVWAADELSAVRDMRLRVLPATGGGHSLEIVAVDLVGNTTRLSWPLGRF